jgi:5-methylcytosine-specific restriction endonuclease McrA
MSYVKRSRKLQIFQLSGGRCYWCGVSITRETSTVDHVLAVKHGGTQALHNLVAACYPCNSRKGHQNAREWAQNSTWLARRIEAIALGHSVPTPRNGEKIRVRKPRP